MTDNDTTDFCSAQITQNPNFLYLKWIVDFVTDWVWHTSFLSNVNVELCVPSMENPRIVVNQRENPQAFRIVDLS